MPGKETQYQLPLPQLPPLVQLVKNREEQRAADAQKGFEEPDHSLEFFRGQPIEGIDFDPIIGWMRVFLSISWLSLLSGSFLFIFLFVLKLFGF